MEDAGKAKRSCCGYQELTNLQNIQACLDAVCRVAHESEIGFLQWSQYGIAGLQQCSKEFGKEGIDQSVDLDKAIGFTEQLERKIEETKEQLRETNSEEKKAQQERKKVLDIQEKHTIN